MTLTLGSESDCRRDLLSLEGVTLRLDPGEGRTQTTRHSTAGEGGGEYNLACGLRCWLGQRTVILTALADNPIVAPAPEPRFEPGAPAPDRMYVGRVDAVTPDGVVEGAVWRFATGGPGSGADTAPGRGEVSTHGR